MGAQLPRPGCKDAGGGTDPVGDLPLSGTAFPEGRASRYEIRGTARRARGAYTFASHSWSPPNPSSILGYHPRPITSCPKCTTNASCPKCPFLWVRECLEGCRIRCKSFGVEYRETMFGIFRVEKLHFAEESGERSMNEIEKGKLCHFSGWVRCSVGMF